MTTAGRATSWWASLGLRIALAVALSATLATVAVGAIVLGTSAVNARERLRAQAFEKLDAAAIFYAEGDGALRFNAEIDPPDLPQSLREDAPAGQKTSLYDGTNMWAVQRLGRGQLLTVRESGSRLNADRRDAVRSWMTGGAIVIVAGTLVGFLVGHTLSRRLRAGARAALAIAAGDEHARATQPGRDEVAALTRSVDAMAAALGRRITVEREFSADVAHELRSPVTALVSATELLPDDEASALVRNQVSRLRRLVEDLLEISRLESGSEQVTWEQLAADQLGLRAGEDAGVPVEVRSAAPVYAEQRRVDRVLGNLLANAHRHGGGQVRVVVDGPAITVCDEGPGYPETLLDHGPRRFSTHGHGPGSGLGLTIAMRQAEVLDADLRLRNKPDGGACATLTLRTDPPPNWSPPDWSQPVGEDTASEVASSGPSRS